MPLQIIRQFLKLETAGGIVLFMATLMALLIDNSPFSNFYQQSIQTTLHIHLLGYQMDESLLFWVNEGLMTLFFLLVGLELKREFVDGELAQPSKVLLPALAACGGMLAPAIVYIICNFSQAIALKGWAIPVATDIAFALGVLSIFGRQVPLGLKLFLLALAIFDDIGAIIIITLFYSHGLHYLLLLSGGLIIVGLWCLNKLAVKRTWPYLLLGIILWACISKSGVHASVVGVVLALMMPMNRNFESKLHPWVAFFIVPLFAFTNAGISFSGMHWGMLYNSITLGIMLGLVLGKQLGILSVSWIAIRSGIASLPKGSTWLSFYGIALLCGIGFTMSLFLGTLAFQNDQPIYLVDVRLGVLLGSIISGLIGALVLHKAFKKNA